MIKKLLILPLIGGIMSFGAFASANTVGNWSSDSQIFNCLMTDENGYDTENQYCLIVDYGDYGWTLTNGQLFQDISCASDGGYLGFVVSSDNNFNLSNFSSLGNGAYYYGSFDGNDEDISGIDGSPAVGTITNGVFSCSPLVYTVSNGGSDNSSSIVPSIPSSFTSGITALVSNFGSILVGWLPTIILVALGITAIFALFRVVRNYARSSFNG